MSDSQGQLSSVTAVESSLNETTAAQEFGDSLTDTARYFDAWLETLKPSRTDENSLPPSPKSTSPRIAPEYGNGSRFTFEGTLRVDCYVKGVIPSETGTLIVNKTGEIEADIFVATAIIDGVVRGDVCATERVELGSNARVIGNIEAPALSIHPGAVFEGRSSFRPPNSQTSVADDRDSDSSRLAQPRSGDAEKQEPRTAVAAAAC